MNIAKIEPCSIANGPGVRVAVFVSGCRRHCQGCHNQQAWDFEYGEPYTEETKEYILQLLEPDYIDGITILGGEPFEPENETELSELLWDVVNRTEKSVWVYTGYTLEELMRVARTSSILTAADVLVDGEYREAERDITLKYRGSRNQRIIDMMGTFIECWRSGEVVPVLWKGGEA